MMITILGLGYVGLTAAACALKDGHRAHGIDVSAQKAAAVAAGRPHLHEPGVAELLAAGLAENRLTTATEIGPELGESDIAMVCVGTPSLPDGAHNMTHIVEVTRQVARALAGGADRARPLTLVYRSTVRPGTMTGLIRPILERRLGDRAAALVELVYNPEFLRESTAVADYFAPPKIVTGTADGAPCAALERLYEGIEAPRFAVPYPEAELTKFVDNAFHGLKVAFANEIGRLAMAHGVSAAKAHEIFVADTKLNVSPSYLRPGGPFGGSCLPKDLRALSRLFEEAGTPAPVIDAVLASNETHKRFLFEAACGGLAPGSSVLLNGLAFKPDSDDLRESPLLDLAAMVLRAGHGLAIHDPHVDLSALHGANLGHGLARLPGLAELLVPRAALAGRRFDLVLDGRGDAASLPVAAAPVFDLTRIP